MMHTLRLPVLHGSGGDPTGFLNSDWRPEPTVVLGIVALIAAYVAWTGPLNRRRPDAAQRPVRAGQQAAFIAGSLALLIVLAPPLDDWADHYLLSAHMFQHLAMLFLVAPFWLVGLPAWVFDPLLQQPIVAKAGALLTRPIASFAIANAIVTIWHLPGPYDAALRHEPVHILQHGAFLVAALFAWWPVLSPLPAWPRLSLPLQCLYLFLTSIPGGIIGAFVTLAAPGVYNFYETVPRIWGIDLATDQELAGLMMWVGAGLIYLLWITVLFFRWAAREEANEGVRPQASGVRDESQVSGPRSQVASSESSVLGT
jgi:cytochrome c oxidase assembly factor CtaG